MENNIEDNVKLIKSDLIKAENELQRVIEDLKIERENKRALGSLYLDKTNCQDTIKELKYKLSKYESCENEGSDNETNKKAIAIAVNNNVEIRPSQLLWNSRIVENIKPRKLKIEDCPVFPKPKTPNKTLSNQPTIS